MATLLAAGLAAAVLLWLIYHLTFDEAVAYAPIQPRLAWFYKPPNDGDLTTLAQRFDFFVLTKTDEPVRDALRARGERGPFIQYLVFTELVDPMSCSEQPWRNQVTDRVGDFCMISEKHPDWFLRDVDGDLISSPVHDGVRYVMMDPGNPDWRAFWLERALQMEKELGWDGAFLDNVEASLSKIKERGYTPADYPDDASYQAAVEGFLEYLHTNHFGPQRRLLYANIVAMDDDSVWMRYLQYLDGAMDEAWAVDWHDQYVRPDDWEADLKRAEQTQAMRREAILVSQGGRPDLQRQQFAYASYLLVNNGRASFRYADAEGAYDEAWTHPLYDLDPGVPQGPRQCLGRWLCWRPYSKAWVWVTPAGRMAGIISRY